MQNTQHAQSSSKPAAVSSPHCQEGGACTEVDGCSRYTTGCLASIPHVNLMVQAINQLLSPGKVWLCSSGVRRLAQVILIQKLSHLHKECG